MIPWDFGLINALKKELDIEIFPSEPPDELQNKPYLVFELKNIRQHTGQMAKAEIQLRIIDKEAPSSFMHEFISKVRKAIAQKLSLKQGECEIGEANIKMEKLVMNKSDTILNLIALLDLRAIYEDEVGANE